MKTSGSERQLVCTESTGAADQNLVLSGRPLEGNMPNDAPDLSRAERLVYLFPDGFDAGKFIEGQLNGKRIFDYRRNVPPAGTSDVDPHVFFGQFRGQTFALEVRPRSATIAAEAFETRRDLLLELKEFVEKK